MVAVSLKNTEGVQDIFDLLASAFQPLTAFMPFVLVELKERGLTMDDVRAMEDTEEKRRLGAEIIAAVKNRAKAYTRAKEFLSMGGTIEEAMEHKGDVENIAAALSPFMPTDRKAKASDIQSKLIREWFSLDWLRDPDDAVAAWSTEGSKKHLQAALNYYYKGIAKEVAKETNSTLDQVLDPEKRTKAQETASINAFAEEIRTRLQAFFSSRYVDAWKRMNGDEKEGQEAALVKMAILYFFATLPQDAPGSIDEGKLTEPEAERVSEIYAEIVSFAEDHPFTEDAGIAFLFDFIKYKNPGEKEQEKLEKSLQVIAQEVEKIDFPLDKVNNSIWTEMELSTPHGQLAMDFNFEEHMDDLFEIDMTSPKDRSKGKEAIVLYGLSFDLENLPEGVKITKQITPYDRRCHDAVGALSRAGNEIVSPAQIYRAMGRKGSPSKTETKKINDSLTKMRAAMLYIDSSKEAAVYQSKAIFHYDGSLLPFERVRATINGRETDSAIHIFREPPLIDFARKRGQITTLDISIRETPLSLTDSHIRIEDYLTEQISHMKNNRKFSRKITLDKLFDRCKIKTKKQRFDTKAAIKELLKYWKTIGFIGERSKLEDECITIDI